jgi:hypothetical protein
LVASGCVTGPSFLSRPAQQTFLVQQLQPSSARLDPTHARVESGITTIEIATVTKTIAEPALLI